MSSAHRGSAAGVADVDELAGLRDVPDDADARRHAQLGQLGQRRDARADLAGRAVDQPQRRAVGAERARDAARERREQVVELDLARDHRAEIRQQLEPLLVLDRAHAASHEHRTDGLAAAARASRAREHEALARRDGPGQRGARVGLERGELRVAAPRVVVEQHELRHARRARELGARLPRRVAPADLRRILLGRVLRVVDQDVGAGRELLERRIDAREVLGVGRVHDRLTAVLEPEAVDRIGVVEPRHRDGDVADRELIVRRAARASVTVPPSVVELDREERRAEQRADRLRRAASRRSGRSRSRRGARARRSA